MTDAAASTEAVEHERCESAMATLPSHSLRLRQRKRSSILNQPRCATVMISGLVSASGWRSQSPNCSVIVRPALDKNEDNESIPRNLNVLLLT